MPKASRKQSRELGRKSVDCSFLLTHLVRQNEGRTDDEARRTLEHIVGLSGEERLLQAHGTGWYKGLNSTYIFNPSNFEFDGTVNCKAVCFTEATLAGLKAHRDLFKAKYGLAFDRDRLHERGANPCINISEQLLQASIPCKAKEGRRVYNFIPEPLIPFVNIINSWFDATHEREWRYAANLHFEISEVRFLFCPEADFPLFSTLQVAGMPCLFDLAWLDRV